MTHTSATIGSEQDPHRISLATIRSPSGFGHQYAAECKCGWVTVNVMPRMTEAQAVRHYTTNKQ